MVIIAKSREERNLFCANISYHIKQNQIMSMQEKCNPQIASKVFSPPHQTIKSSSVRPFSPFISSCQFHSTTTDGGRSFPVPLLFALLMNGNSIVVFSHTISNGVVSVVYMNGGGGWGAACHCVVSCAILYTRNSNEQNNRREYTGDQKLLHHATVASLPVGGKLLSQTVGTFCYFYSNRLWKHECRSAVFAWLSGNSDGSGRTVSKKYARHGKYWWFILNQGSSDGKWVELNNYSESSPTTGSNQRFRKWF